MKRLFFAPLLVLFILLCASGAQAAVLLGSLSTITTATTNTIAFQTNSVSIPLPQVTVSNNTLASTNNSYAGAFRWSFDGITYYTNSSPVYTPPTTVAGSVTIPAQSVQVSVIVQMLAITNVANTSTIQIGVTSP